MGQPIWKDYQVDLGSSDSGIDYTIHTGLSNSSATTIYEGTAYRRPGETSVLVKINDICADYLRQAFVAAEELPLSGYFSVWVNNSRKGNVFFYLNYEYKDGDIDKVTTYASAHAPITGRAVGGQRIWFTCLRDYANAVLFGMGGEIPESFYLTDGAAQNVVRTPDGDVGLAYINLEDEPQCRVRYTYRPRCGERYVLEYVNALGGIDCFTPEGLVRQTDSYSRRTITQEYDNANAGRGTRNWRNDITRRWSIHTGWLTQDEASRMHHLLGSPLVQLYDLDTDEVLPVIVTNADCPYKIQRDGMIDYELIVELAQDMARQ